MKPRSKAKPLIFDAEGYQTNLKDLNGTPLPDLSKVRAFSGRSASPKTSGRPPILLRHLRSTARK